MIKIAKINLKEVFDTFPYGMEDIIPGDLWDLKESKPKKNLKKRRIKEKTNERNIRKK